MPIARLPDADSRQTHHTNVVHRWSVTPCAGTVPVKEIRILCTPL